MSEIEKATVTLPTAWKVVVVIGSIASTLVLSVLSFAFQGVREEWREMRSDVRGLREKVATQPTRDEFGKLSDDVQDIEKRVTKIESTYWTP